MTTARLIQLVRLDPTLRDLNVDMKDEEICVRGSHAQAEILRECEILEEEQTITTEADKETYTSGTYSWLAKVVRFRDTMYHLGSNNLTVVHRAKKWIDQDRERVAKGGAQALPPRFFYILLTRPITVGFWYIPDDAYQIKTRFVRGHSASDNLEYAGTAVHPLVPDEFEDVLVVGTVANILENRIPRDAQFERGKVFARQLFESRKTKIKLSSVNANIGVMRSHSEVKF